MVNPQPAKKDKSYKDVWSETSKRTKVISVAVGALLGIYLGGLVWAKIHGVSWVEAATGTYLNLPLAELLSRWIMAFSAIGIWACVFVVIYILMKREG